MCTILSLNDFNVLLFLELVTIFVVGGMGAKLDRARCIAQSSLVLLTKTENYYVIFY